MIAFEPEPESGTIQAIDIDLRPGESVKAAFNRAWRERYGTEPPDMECASPEVEQDIVEAEGRNGIGHQN